LGAQFSPVTKLTSGHFGLFWKSLSDDWSEPSDKLPLEDQFETFESIREPTSPAMQVRLGPIPLPGRFLIGHKEKDRLIQIQSTRFHLNWRKTEGFYPSYKNLIAEFEQTFGRFEAFTQNNELGRLLLNQWEITYIDAFPKGEQWQTPADWSGILPGLFGGLFPTDGLLLRLDHRAAEWSFELEPRRGRLHIVARLGRWGLDKQDCLLLHTTVRGPIGGTGVSTLREGLDLGHEAAVQSFLRVASKQEQSRWGMK
jgi:uncharacterized protein (TIGR04255 family)